MRAIINISVLLSAIRAKGLSGFTEAAGLCRVSPKVFKKLSTGELPRLDAVMRVCKGLDISESDLIVGPVKLKSDTPAKVVEIKKAL